jgi:DNA modification methylase
LCYLINTIIEKIPEEKKGGVVKYKDRSIPDGSLCNVPSRFVIAMTNRLGFVQKNDISWEKPNGFPNGAIARRRFSINYEHVLFCKRYSILLFPNTV